MAIPRRSHACTVLGDKVYVMGGYGVELSTEIMSLTGNSWAPGPALPDGVEAVAGQAVAHDGSIYFISTYLQVLRLKSDNSGWTEIRAKGMNYYYGMNYPAQIVTDKVLNCN